MMLLQKIIVMKVFLLATHVSHFSMLTNAEMNLAVAILKLKKNQTESAKMQLCISWLLIEIVKNVFENATQNVRASSPANFKTNYKRPFLDLIIHRRHEIVDAKTFCCDTPVIGEGSTSDRAFVGKETLLTGACGMKSDE